MNAIRNKIILRTIVTCYIVVGVFVFSQAYSPVIVQSYWNNETVSDTTPIKIWASKEVQELIAYARDLTKNKDFILTIEQESKWNWQAVGDWGTSYWLCQWHLPKRLNWRVNNDDPTIASWYAMVDTCWKTWKLKWNNIWNWLHGYTVRHTVEDRFIFYDEDDT